MLQRLSTGHAFYSGEILPLVAPWQTHTPERPFKAFGDIEAHCKEGLQEFSAVVAF